MAAPIPAITNRRSMPITSARGPAKIKPIGPAIKSVVKNGVAIPSMMFKAANHVRADRPYAKR